MKNNKKINEALNLWAKVSKTFETIRRDHVKSLLTHSLTGPQFGVLEVLYLHGSMPLKKIGERLFVSGANITCVVDNLEKEKYVKRVPSTVDRRIILAELTEGGKVKMDEIFPTYSESIHNVLGALNDEEQHKLYELLDKVVPEK